MERFDYEGEIQKVEYLLNNDHYRAVGTGCGIILEHCLRNLYEEVLKIADKDDKFKFTTAEKIIREKNKDVNLSRFYLLIDFYEMVYLFEFAEERLCRDFTVAKRMDLHWFRVMRNKCAHVDQTPPTDEELNFFYSSLKSLLREAGYITKGSSQKIIEKCPSCNEEVDSNHTYCPNCRNPLSQICFRCGSRIEKQWTACTKCNAPSDLEQRIKHIKSDILNALDKNENCPICGARVEIYDGEFDSDTRIGETRYDHTCFCLKDICKILTARDLNIKLTDPTKDYIEDYLFSTDLTSLLKVTKCYQPIS